MNKKLIRDPKGQESGKLKKRRAQDNNQKQIQGEVEANATLS